MMRSILPVLFLALLFLSCNTTDSGKDPATYINQSGILKWAGSPVVDGAGMLLIVDDKEYGAPGTPDDYDGYFGDEVYEVEVIADYKLTGKKTVRGWGVTYPEIEILKLNRQ